MGGGMYGNRMGMNPNGNDFFSDSAESLFRFHELLSLNGQLLDQLANYSEFLYNKCQRVLQWLQKLCNKMERLTFNNPQQKQHLMKVLLYLSSVLLLFLMYSLKSMRQKKEITNQLGKALYYYKSAL